MEHHFIKKLMRIPAKLYRNLVDAYLEYYEMATKGYLV